MMNIKIIESKAEQIVRDFNGTKLPIDVNAIAQEIGLEIKAQDLGDNVSGVLFIDKGKGMIGYNPSESDVRVRFTVAHELGHFILHRLNKELFVDHKQFKAVFRDNESKTGELVQEREANAFAAALLMPKHLLIKELENNFFDLGGDTDVLKKLAKKFKVSSQAMVYRLINLNLY